MLLSFCFRKPSKKKHKKHKIWKNEKARDSENSNVLSKSLISSPIISSTITKPVINPKLAADLQDINLSQESLLSTKEEINLKQEGGELQIHRRSVPAYFESPQKCSSSTPFSKGPQNRISSPNFTNISTIQCKKELQLIPRDVRPMFASAEDLDGPNLSVSNTHHTYQSCNPSLASSSTQPPSEVFITPNTKPNQILDSNKKATHSQGINSTPNRNSIVQEGNFNSGSDVLKEESNISVQIRNEEKSARKEEMEGFLQKIREENEKKMEAMKIQHHIEFERVKEALDFKLLDEKESHRKDLEKATTNAKNEANETISRLNRQIILERGKMFAEQQENSRHLEEEFKMKDDRVNQSMKHIEEREQAWEDERADVLTEVQRLKAEATRMVKILAMEYEQDNLSEDKKISLSQEVYSLQLVVEMRTGEVRNLREQLAKTEQKLDQADIHKEKLRKATARMEDLEEQIKIKNNLEKKLSYEKCQLEMNMTNTSKVVDRMSKNVESLQWRIRNNFDLPVDNLTPVTSEQQYQDKQRTSLPAFFADQQRSCTESITTHPQRTATNVMEVMDVKSDILPGYVGCNTSFINDDHEKDKKDTYIEFKANEDHQDNDSFGEVDSLDEGVGDISSDGENPDSPTFGLINGISDSNNIIEVAVITHSDKNDVKVSDLSPATDSDQPTNKQSFNSSTTSLTKERIPSRF